jgi:hypothetical protein
MSAEMFGKPGEGIHKHFFGVAVADVALTGAAAIIIGKTFNKSIPMVFMGLVILGVGAHAYFKVPTALNKKLGIAEDPQLNMMY